MAVRKVEESSSFVDVVAFISVIAVGLYMVVQLGDFIYNNGVAEGRMQAYSEETRSRLECYESSVTYWSKNGMKGNTIYIEPNETKGESNDKD